MSETRQVVTGTAAAPAEAVFAALADPAQHVEMDASETCQKPAPGTAPISALGQSFVMHMAHPDLGEYQTRNTVVGFEPGRKIAWATTGEVLSPEIQGLLGDIEPGGHVFGWELKSTPDGQTAVTHFYDWSTIKDPRFAAFFPFISAEQMAGSVARLGEIVARPG
jgi:hypothetical protein